MRFYLLIYFVITLITNALGQSESNNWPISPNGLINFSSGIGAFSPNSSVCDYPESNSAISDDNGNLLFYSDGDTVRGATHLVLPNGADLSPVIALKQSSTTQGVVFIQKPASNNIYYLFSLGNIDHLEDVLCYSVIDKSLNGGLGEVISTQNILLREALSEKMVTAKHCNNRDYWLIVVKYNVSTFNSNVPKDYSIEFQSFLITSDGVQGSPITSEIETKCPLYGQMKINNAGDEIAFAGNNYLSRFSFDNSTGVITLKSVLDLPLENGYGIEYSSNDLMIYINEKQFNTQTEELTNLLNQNSPSQLQRGSDGKIYRNIIPSSEIYVSPNDDWFSSNSWIKITNQDTQTYLGIIHSPNNPGISCQFDTNEIIISHPNNYRNYITIPNFPPYHLNSKISEFSYTGTCVADAFQFTIDDVSSVDSIHWLFHDTGFETTSDTANFTFPVSGEWQVTCTVYQNGQSFSSTQCVNVCGSNAITLPETIDLCLEGSTLLNALSPCVNHYQWNTGDTTSSILINSPGTYILESTSTCGVFYDTTEVIKGDLCNADFFIPNIITANNDLINDEFIIQVKNAKSFDFKIVNRWGGVVKEGNVDIASSQVFDWNSFSLWNGFTHQGKAVNEGTYFYVIHFTTMDNAITKANGFVQVVE